MSYCSKCGRELPEGAAYCTACGTPISGNGAVPRQAVPDTEDKVGGGVIALGVVGLIFAILLPLIAYPCSIVGLVLANNELQRGKTSKTSGRTLNIVALVIAGINSILGILFN